MQKSILFKTSKKLQSSFLNSYPSHDLLFVHLRRGLSTLAKYVFKKADIIDNLRYLSVEY